MKGEITAIILSLHGLGGGPKSEPNTEELEWGHQGGLVVHPYCGPWSWMNRQIRAMIDALVDSIYVAYSLTESVPLICTGGSMGGLGSLLYTRYAKHSVSACLANCPVCDLKFHFHERSDLPKTIRHAFLGYPEDLDNLFAEHSPLEQVAAMPDIPYRIIHGDEDPAVSKQNHSDRMVTAMREHGLNVEYIEVPGMGHCGPLPLKALEDNVSFVTAITAERRS